LSKVLKSVELNNLSESAILLKFKIYATTRSSQIRRR